MHKGENARDAYEEQKALSATLAKRPWPAVLSLRGENEHSGGLKMMEGPENAEAADDEQWVDGSMLDLEAQKRTTSVTRNVQIPLRVEEEDRRFGGEKFKVAGVPIRQQDLSRVPQLKELVHPIPKGVVQSPSFQSKLCRIARAVRSGAHLIVQGGTAAAKSLAASVVAAMTGKQHPLRL
mmetsp:Transcript_58705/g.120092  ORF Transcript_58705/g.120092 Transcript_58705/m.120092 type:complete len:180 (-) Transcript_58705:78-617(-)